MYVPFEQKIMEALGEIACECMGDVECVPCAVKEKIKAILKEEEEWQKDCYEASRTSLARACEKAEFEAYWRGKQEAGDDY